MLPPCKLKWSVFLEACGYLISRLCSLPQLVGRCSVKHIDALIDGHWTNQTSDYNKLPVLIITKFQTNHINFHSNGIKSSFMFVRLKLGQFNGFSPIYHPTHIRRNCVKVVHKYNQQQYRGFFSLSQFHNDACITLEQ